MRSYLEREHGLDVRVWEAQSRVGTNPKEFLREELEQCVFAVMVVTADDSTPEGRRRGRQNVIHETGLFQSKLGFEKVALIVEEGVEGCSNLAGIDVITFKPRRIDQAFHALDAVLRREGLVAPKSS